MSYAGSTSSSSSTSTVSNGRYWGLASGLDVDSIVTAECSNEQSKIDKAKQQQQTIEWQQEGYQDVITKLQDFQSAYLKIGGSNSMATSTMYSVYTAASDNSKLTVKAGDTSDGAGHTVDIIQSAVTASVTGAELGKIKGNFGTIAADTSFSMTVDGVTKTISFTADDVASITNASKTNQQVLNDKLLSAFGSVGGVAKVSVDGSSSFTMNEASGYNMSISVSNPSSGTSALASLGLTSGQSNRISTSSTLNSLFSSTNGSFNISINSKTITLDGSKSLSDNLNLINNAGVGVTASYDSTSGSISIVSKTSGAAGSVTLGSDSVSTNFFNTILGGSGKATAGQDAIVSIDGTKYARNTNSFSIKGVSYTINGTVSASSSITGITVSQTTDTSSLKTGIKSFISAYNSLIDAISSYTDSKPDSSYPVLTDDEKKNMTQTQIDNYNTRAKSGVLYNDNTLTGLMESLRSMVDQSVTSSDGTKFSLYSLGITSSDNWSDNGKIEITTDNEAKFEKALSENADKISELFLKQSSISLNTASKSASGKKQRTAQEGLVDRLDDILDTYTGYVNGKSGTLLSISGSNNDSYSITNSTLFQQLQDLNSNIIDYTSQLKSKEERLYTKFQQLETYMEKANSQSSMLSAL